MKRKKYNMYFDVSVFDRFQSYAEKNIGVSASRLIEMFMRETMDQIEGKDRGPLAFMLKGIGESKRKK